MEYLRKINISSKEELSKSTILLAKSFRRDFNITERLKLTPTQSTLFDTYFAGYFCRKYAGDLSYLLRLPATQVLEKIPLLGRIVSKMRKRLETFDEVADEYLETGAHWKKIMYDSPNLSQMEFLQQEYGADTDRAVHLLPPTVKGIFLGTEIGNPEGIQEAANLITASLKQSLPAFYERKKVNWNTVNKEIGGIIEMIERQRFGKNLSA